MNADYDKYGSLFDSPAAGDDTLAIIEQFLTSGGTLEGMNYPYANQQTVIDQQMALADQLRQGGPRHSTPTGALLGGISDALGKVGGAVKQHGAMEMQKDLGTTMQKDATGRMNALLQMLRQKQQPAGSMGLLPTMSDADLSALMGE